jgi:hypothetical protein
MRYYFDVKNGHRLIDPAGLECGNDQEAIQAGEVIAQQIAREAVTAQPRHVDVLNSNRESIGQVAITLKNSGKSA